MDLDRMVLQFLPYPCNIGMHPNVGLMLVAACCQQIHQRAPKAYSHTTKFLKIVSIYLCLKKDLLGRQNACAMQKFIANVPKCRSDLRFSQVRMKRSEATLLDAYLVNLDS